MPQCRYCPQELYFIDLPGGKRTPVHPKPVRRMGSAPLPKGTYYTIQGERYLHHEVPNGIDVFLSHWGNCPGAKEARKKK